MRKRVKEIIEMFFGKTPAKRFKRLVMFLGALVISVILIQNISCSYSKKDGVKFEWRPAAKIEVKR